MYDIKDGDETASAGGVANFQDTVPANVEAPTARVGGAQDSLAEPLLTTEGRESKEGGAST